MIDFLIGWQSLAELMLINCLLALSQYVVLRAGVFSVATAAFAALGAYGAALMHIRIGVPAPLALVFAVFLGLASSLLLSLPLARLRGVFQAIATLAFVQIVMALNLNATDLTGGALGLNGIPKSVGFWTLLCATGLLTYAFAAMSRTALGSAFDAVRQDETVAATLGISIRRTHAMAFALSGAVSGLAGGLIAFHDYSLVPEQFGFSMLVAALAFVVLGGHLSVWGPLAGAVILTALPEVARPVAEQRMLVHGGLLIVVIAYLQHGVVDTLRLRWRRPSRRLVDPSRVGAPTTDMDALSGGAVK
jgi:branched-chain amino acid transport system permease protein